LQNGNFLTPADFQGQPPEPVEDKDCLVYTPEGEFMAIYRYQEAIKAWKVQKMFV
jgi:hypothetical protein